VCERNMDAGGSAGAPMLIEAEHDQMRRAARAEEKSDELNHNSRETATVIPAVRAFDIYGMVAVVPFVAFVLMSLSPKRERASPHRWYYKIPRSRLSNSTHEPITLAKTR